MLRFIWYDTVKSHSVSSLLWNAFMHREFAQFSPAIMLIRLGRANRLPPKSVLRGVYRFGCNAPVAAIASPARWAFCQIVCTNSKVHLWFAIPIGGKSGFLATVLLSLCAYIVSVCWCPMSEAIFVRNLVSWPMTCVSFIM